MGQDPEQLRAEIAQTREELDDDLSNLGEKVSPGAIAERRVEAVKGSLTSVKEKVMGAADHASSSGSSDGGALSSASDAVTGAPGLAKAKASGNPLAAGLVAFGVGWLVSSLLPASQSEARAAGAVKDAVAEPLKSQLSSAAGDIKEQIAPAAQDAIASVKDTATEAAGTVKDQATDAAGTVKDQATDSAGTVTDQAKDARDQVQAATP